ANTHDTILCFSSRGKVYWLKVYQVPRASRGSRGRPIVNLLPLEPDERINAILPLRDYDTDGYIFMATSGGTVKKTPVSQFARPRSTGLIAIDLRGDDRLVDAAITDGEQDILLVASTGKAIRFHESDVRAMGRGAAGVRGIKLPGGHEVIGLSIVGEGLVLTATENGYGKRTALSDFPVQGRGGQGVIAIQTSERNGRTVGALQVADEDEIMLISSNGTLVRTPVADISVQGRNTQGVRLIRVGSGHRLVGLARIELDEEE
ncbi:MAG: DNA gyrase C-terminal beta-propeller domain-containing protein, partial [Pseudomonadota bacterium]